MNPLIQQGCIKLTKKNKINNEDMCNVAKKHFKIHKLYKNINCNNSQYYFMFYDALVIIRDSFQKD